MSSVSISIPLSLLFLCPIHSLMHSLNKRFEMACVPFYWVTLGPQSHIKTSGPHPSQSLPSFLFHPFQPNLSMEIYSPSAPMACGLLGLWRLPCWAIPWSPGLHLTQPSGSLPRGLLLPPSCISGFPPTFCLSVMNRPFFLPQ